MSNHSLKELFKNILILLIIGFSLFGLLKYFDYRLVLISGQIERTERDKALLQDKYNSMEKKVEVLDKLNSLDPELLKRYSKVYFLNEHYIPSSLSAIPRAYLNGKATHFQMHTNVLPYLGKLMEASNIAGLNLQALSAYRSFGEQAKLKAGYVMTYGSTAANRFSADQGYSEHQLGTTIDFTTLQLNGELSGFDKTAEYKWLVDNAYKYGFIVSYPAENIYYKFEPWHWRFVGVGLATKLHEDKINFHQIDQRMIDKYLPNIFE